jgi:hypothetical protein
MTDDLKGPNSRVCDDEAPYEALCINAQDAFAWLAFGDDESFATFFQDLMDNPLPPTDPVRKRKMDAMGTARDRVVLMAQAESIAAFVQSPTGADIKPVPSIVFAQGLTIGILNGKITRSEQVVMADDASVDVAKRAYEGLKADGLTEQVWFRRAEIYDIGRSVPGARQGVVRLTSPEMIEDSPTILGSVLQSQEQQTKNVPALDKDQITLTAVRWPAPIGALMTACEVLTWIAFGSPLPKERLGEGDNFERWHTEQLDDLLVALDARASFEPFAPLEPAYRKPHRMGFYVGQYWAASCRKLRARARKSDQRLVSFGDLRDQLRDDLNRQRNGDVLIKMAAVELIERLRDGQFNGIGRLNGAAPDEIPTRTFWDRSVSVTWWDTIGAEYHGPQFEDVQFRTSDILRIWPPVRKPTDTREGPHGVMPTHEGMSNHQVSTTGLNEKWRDRMTLTHAVARIAYGNVIESRYNIRNGRYVSGRDARRWRGSEWPSTSGLPGTAHLLGLEEQSFETALAAWMVDDERKWRDGERRLRDAFWSRALVARIGEGHAIRRVSQDFWSQHGPLSLEADECFILATEFESWWRAGNDEAAVQPETASDGPPCPMEIADFKNPKTRDDALRAWAKWRYLDGGGSLPGREQLINDHRHHFGHIKGINVQTMSRVVRPLAPEVLRRGGAPAHRIWREN